MREHTSLLHFVFVSGSEKLCGSEEAGRQIQFDDISYSAFSIRFLEILIFVAVVSVSVSFFAVVENFTLSDTSNIMTRSLGETVLRNSQSEREISF